MKNQSSLLTEWRTHNSSINDQRVFCEDNDGLCNEIPKTCRHTRCIVRALEWPRHKILRVEEVIKITTGELQDIIWVTAM